MAVERTSALADALDERLAAQLRFVLEADALKQVERRSRVTGGARRENSAEHSWHLALMALVLADHADGTLDLTRVLLMVLLHDLVEIDAGDTFIYDDTGHATKAAREQAAADRLFGLLPFDQGADLHAAWHEFETGETPEARFARALDRLAPLLLNHADRGRLWAEHGITAEHVRDRNSPIGDGSARLWLLAQRLIDDAVEAGYLHPGHAGRALPPGDT